MSLILKQSLKSQLFSHPTLRFTTLNIYDWKAWTPTTFINRIVFLQTSGGVRARVWKWRKTVKQYSNRKKQTLHVVYQKWHHTHRSLLLQPQTVTKHQHRLQIVGCHQILSVYRYLHMRSVNMVQVFLVTLVPHRLFAVTVLRVNMKSMAWSTNEEPQINSAKILTEYSANPFRIYQL